MNQKFSLHHVKLSTIILLIVITAIISGLTSGIIVYSSYSKSTGISYKTINNDVNLKEFLEVYQQVSNEYYEKVDKKELVKQAISGMLDYLDDNYTTYLDKDQTDKLYESLAGTYYGIGVYISDHTIVGVFDNSPAKEAGLLVGDVITKVDGEDASNLSSEEIASKIKNSEKKEVKLSVLRGDANLELTIKLSNLFVPAVTAEVIDGTKICYLGISSFSSTLSEQVNDAINKFDKEDVESIIIDLRSNTGGYLTSAESVSNLFLEKGKVIYSLKSKDKKEVIKDTTDKHTDYKMVVLVNGSTASAAEILAAALKESYGATIVGKKTYGKGKVQQTVSLSDGSMAKYTTAKWYTPNGDCIDQEGIKPDYEVDIKIEKDENKQIINVVDTQLEKAIEVLSN